MAERIVNREQLNNQVATTVPQLVKESRSQADRFLGSVANGISKLVFRWGMTSAFRIANTNIPKFPFSNDLSLRERIRLNADLTGISSDRSW